MKPSLGLIALSIGQVFPFLSLSCTIFPRTSDKRVLIRLNYF
nr:MAG TPA: hypothetical protein [Bacteriophage sp.]